MSPLPSGLEHTSHNKVGDHITPQSIFDLVGFTYLGKVPFS